MNKQTVHAKHIFSDLSIDHLELIKTIVEGNSPTRECLILNSLFGRSKTDTLTRELNDAGIVDIEKTESPGKGRKPFRYTMSRSVGNFIGMELNPSYDRFVLTDYNGTVIESAEYESSMDQNDPFISVHKNLERFLNGDGDRPERVWAIGMGIQGLSDTDPGLIKQILFDPDEFDETIKKRIEDELSLPVFMDWPKVLLHARDLRRAPMDGARIVIDALLDYGTGIGIFIDNEYFTGETGFAGGLGHIIMPGNERTCYCGNTGCMRTLVSFRGICTEALSRLGKSEGSTIGSSLDTKTLSGPHFEQGVRQIIDLALKQDKLCINLVYDIGAEVGRQLATVITLLNPGALVIHSNLVHAGDIFTAPLTMMIRRNAFASSLEKLRTEFRTIDPYAFAEGGALHAIRSFTNELVERSRAR